MYVYGQEGIFMKYPSLIKTHQLVKGYMDMSKDIRNNTTTSTKSDRRVRGELENTYTQSKSLSGSYKLSLCV